MKNKPDFKTKPSLTQGDCLLRPFQEQDIPELIEILNDPIVNHLTGSVITSEEAEAKMTPEETLQVSKWYRTRNAQLDRLDLALVSLKLNKIVGEVVLNEWDQANNSCNFRILIGPTGRDQGLGSIATKLIVKYAFNYLKLHRLELEVYTFNPRARHVYEKNGFIYEGTRRQVLNYDGQWYDADLLAMLKSDYQASLKS